MSRWWKFYRAGANPGALLGQVANGRCTEQSARVVGRALGQAAGCRVAMTHPGARANPTQVHHGRVAQADWHLFFPPSRPGLEEHPVADLYTGTEAWAKRVAQFLADATGASVAYSNNRGRPSWREHVARARKTTPQTSNPGRFVFGQPRPTIGVSASIRPGDRVTYVDRFGKERSGRAVLPSAHGGWVLNIGGAHGTPAVVDNSNIVRVAHRKGNPQRFANVHDVAGVFGWPKWHELTLHEAELVLRDVAEIADEDQEGEPDDIAAARTLRQRIGGADQLKGYARVLVAGEKRNPSRSKGARARRTRYRAAIGGGRRIRRAVAASQQARGARRRFGYVAKYRHLQTESALRGLRTAPRSGARRNPSQLNLAHASAERTFRMWHGFRAGGVVKMPRTRTPRVAVKLGELKSVTYTSDKWTGRKEDYVHTFRKPRPLLCTGPTARGLHIVGGGYSVTPRGITN